LFEVIVDGGELRRPLGSHTLVVGRAPGCDLVLADDSVSGRHAALWVDDRGAWVQDLGSRNGVTLDGTAIQAPTLVPPGAEIRLGRTLLRIQAAAAAIEHAGLLVEDMGSGHATAFAGDRLRIGDSVKCQIRIPGADEVVILDVGGGEALIGRDDDMTPLPRDVPFEVAGRAFVLRAAPAGWRSTRDLGELPRGYRIEATLEAGPGPRAVVLDPASGRQYVMTAENRATLLWILARRWLDDRAGGAGEDDAGWVPEPDALTQVWGRSPGATAANLRVLVCRIRRELREAGLDPWFLEHRAGCLRVKVQEVVIR
jgi:hypothetical protein